MNTILLNVLGISPHETPGRRKELLEVHQSFLISRLQTEAGSTQRQEITRRLQVINQEIEATRQEISQRHNVPPFSETGMGTYQTSYVKTTGKALNSFTLVEYSETKSQIAFRIIGPILLVLGMLYLFGGIHPDEWKYNALLAFFPSIWKGFVIPMSFLDSFVNIGTNGKFGLQLITAAFILIFISRPNKQFRKKYPYKSAYSVSKLLCILIVIWHWLVQLINSGDPSENMLEYIILFVGCRLIGHVVEFISQKIKSIIK